MYILHGAPCCQIKRRYVVVSHLACVKNVKTHKTIQNCGLVYSIDREKLHQLMLPQEFIQSIGSDQIFISGEMAFRKNWLHYSKKW